MWTFDKLFIAGEWRAPRSRTLAEVVNPATEEVVGKVAQATREDVDQAVRSARAALTGWKLTPAAERGRIMLRIANLMDEHSEELAEMIISGLGSPAARTRQYMVGFPANTIRFYAKLLIDGTHASV